MATKSALHSSLQKFLKKTPIPLVFIILILVDIFIVLLSDLVSFALRFQTEILYILKSPLLRNFLAYRKIIIFVISLRIIFAYIFGLYERIRTKSAYKLFISSLKANTLSSFIIVTIAFYFRAFAYPRGVIVLSWLITTFFLFLARIIIKLILASIYGEDFLIKKAMIIGKTQEAQRLCLYLENDAQEKFRVVGALSPRDRTFLEQFPKIFLKNIPEAVFFASRDITREQILNITLYIFSINPRCQYYILPEMYESTVGEFIKSDATYSPLVTPFNPELPEGWYPPLKRLIDISISLLGILAFLPLFPFLVLAIKLTSRGPILYKQERVGLHGKKFYIYKLRTMYEEAESRGPQWAKKDDIRITPVGKFLRKYRLDEFPQLINILKNEMSLVGPRPERTYFIEKLVKEIPFFIERLKAKPGITGWAQINYPYANSIEDCKKKFLLDLFYIKNMSPSLDIYIILKTLWIVIKGEGAH